MIYIQKILLVFFSEKFDAPVQYKDNFKLKQEIKKILASIDQKFPQISITNDPRVQENQRIEQKRRQRLSFAFKTGQKLSGL